MHAQPVIDWSLDFARDAEDEPTLVEGLSTLLTELGLPLVRLSTSIRPIDPEVWSRNISWERGRGVTVRARPYGDMATPEYVGSAVEQLYRGGGPIREHVELAPSKFRPIEGLVRQRATDYVIQPIELARSLRSFVSYAIDRAGGFTADELAFLDAIHPAVSNAVRLRSTRMTIGSLLRTYLGPNAAARVESGSVRRGHGAQIQAAIWFCDLREFTVLSQRLPPDRLLRVLDDYFEAVAGPVVDHGGEILKFIGDAMLAVFPAEPTGIADACTRAASAAVAALERFQTDVAETSGPALGRELGMGLALHVGDVFYGNIGARDRLDFTVIGPAVNLAARVQGQCTALGTPLLMTAAFAQLVQREDFHRLGTPALKGIDDPPELVTLNRFVRA